MTDQPDPKAIQFYRFQCSVADVFDRIRFLKGMQSPAGIALEIACTLIWERGKKLVRPNYDGVPNSMDNQLLLDAIRERFPQHSSSSDSLHRRRRRPRSEDNVPVVDYIDPAKGYVTGNVMVVSMRAMRARKLVSSDQLARICAFYKEAASQKATSEPA